MKTLLAFAITLSCAGLACNGPQLPADESVPTPTVEDILRGGWVGLENEEHQCVAIEILILSIGIGLAVRLVLKTATDP